MTLRSGSCQVSLAITMVDDTDLTTITENLRQTAVLNLTPTNTDSLWSDSRVLGEGTSESIDTQNLTGSTGGVAFTSIHAVYINNTGDIDIQVSVPADGVVGLFNATDDAVIVPAGGIFYRSCLDGITSSAGQSKIDITADSGTGDAEYDIVLVGADGGS